MTNSFGFFSCEQCGAEELRCGPCTRKRFCEPCARARVAQSMAKAGKAYQRTEPGRARHQARSLAYYYSRGQERRRQRSAAGAVLKGIAGQEELRRPEEAPADTKGRSGRRWAYNEPSRSLGNQPLPGEGNDGHRCLTHRRSGQDGSPWTIVESAQAVTSAQVATSRGVVEAVDAKTSSCQGSKDHQDSEPAKEGIPHGAACTNRLASGSVLTTVAQVRAALEHACQVGHEGVVVWGRCARCGREGVVVHFDGTLRARARAPS